MNIEDIDAESYKKTLTATRPGIVGISVNTTAFTNGLRIAKVTKSISPDFLVCMGGPHVTICYQEALSHSFVDVVVRSEGESSFLELCQAVSSGASPPYIIRGTVSRTGNDNTVAMVRERISDLDGLPFPARQLMPLHLYKEPGTILTGRGCTFACGYCAGPSIMGKNCVVRSAAGVIAEVKMCIDTFGLSSFYFADETITYDRQRILSICESLSRIKVPGTLGGQLRWTCNSRVDSVSPEILQAMRDAGCTQIQYGMESGSQELLDKLGKKIALQQIEQAVVWSRKAGIIPVLNVVYPLPGETQETFNQTLDFICRMYDAGAEKVVPALLNVFPGSRFMQHRNELGLTLTADDREDFSPATTIFKTRNFDHEVIMNGYSQLLSLIRLSEGKPPGRMEFRQPPMEVIRNSGVNSFQA